MIRLAFAVGFWLSAIAVGLAAAQTATPPDQIKLADGRYPNEAQLARDMRVCVHHAGLSLEQVFRVTEELEKSPTAETVAPQDVEVVLAYANCMNARGYVLPHQK